jgi:hypothetical protein
MCFLPYLPIYRVLGDRKDAYIASQLSVERGIKIVGKEFKKLERRIQKGEGEGGRGGDPSRK